MKKRYLAPKLILRLFTIHDVIVMSGGDGYVNDPFTQDIGG